MAFCPNCGTQLADEAKFCTECGTALAEAHKNAPLQEVREVQPSQPAQVPQHQSAPLAVADPKYQTLGGWLLVFVIGWGLSAASEVGGVFTSLGMLGTVAFLPMLMNILDSIFTAAVGICMIVLVVKRNPLFLRVYQIFSVVEIALSLVSGLVVGSSGFEAVGNSVGVIIGGALGLFLMTMYFCKSVRVRTYMGSTAYQDLALFKVGV